MAPELTTKRLQLRALQPADESFVHAILADPDVRRYLGGSVRSESRSAAFQNYLRPTPGALTWLVKANTPVGLIFISPHRDSLGTELSFQFDASSWGKGYAFEACHAVIGTVAADLVAETQAANARARALLERLGFQVISQRDRFGAAQVIYHRTPT